MKLGGHTEAYTDDRRALPRALDPRARGARASPTTRRSSATACDTVNTAAAVERARRRSRSTSRPSTSATTTGAVDEKVRSENIYQGLYPNDEPAAGKQLRLEQQYFFVSCSLQDMIRICSRRAARPLERLRREVRDPAQRHPPRARVAELMRLLVDEHGARLGPGLGDHPADASATPTTPCCPRRSRPGRCRCSSALLPRHLEIIYEINRRFLDEVACRASPATTPASARLSLIDEARRASACAWRTWPAWAATPINGVAALHTELLQASVLRDFDELWPEKFSNKTNGVTPRRFVRAGQSRPGRADHRGASATAGSRDLERAARARAARRRRRLPRDWRRVKRANKAAPGATTCSTQPASTSTRLAVRRAGQAHPRVQAPAPERAARRHALPAPQARSGARRARRATVLFGGKAAPGYLMAKLIIKLINAVAERGQRRSRRDARMQGGRSSRTSTSRTAQRIYPAADLSEQISTAGKEASGTGNMKFAMNGALTIGTLDGANVEIREEVGRGELLPVRPRPPRKCTRREGARLPAARRSTRASGSCARHRPDRLRALLRRRPRRCSSRSWTRCSTTTSTCCWPTSLLHRLPGARWRGPTATPSAGPACPS